MTWRVYWTWGPWDHQRDFAAPGDAEAFVALLRATLPDDLLTVSVQEFASDRSKAVPTEAAE